jgi:ADP-ribose pyrophosphatase YjhB (NUDIX family)
VSALRPEVCVGAVVIDAGRILLVRRGRGAGIGLWSIPGGRVEGGETLTAAVVREVAEETGLRVVPGEWSGWVERIGPDHHFVIHDFAAALAPGVDPASARAGDDATEVRWQDVAELGAVDELVPGLLEFLRDAGLVP